LNQSSLACTADTRGDFFLGLGAVPAFLVASLVDKEWEKRGGESLSPHPEKL